MSSVSFKLCSYCEQFFGDTRRIAGETVVKGCLCCNGHTDDLDRIRRMIKFYSHRIEGLKSYKEDIDTQIRENEEKISVLKDFLEGKGAAV